jgi:hypothetical protein
MTQRNATFHAQYSDGATYRVIYDPSERKTYLETTSGGKMNVPYLVNGTEFIRFDFHYVPQPGLRGCDWAQNVSRLHAHLALLTPPTKPSAPTPTPIPQNAEDPKLHVEQGGDSFIRLQEAGARGEMEYRANRQQARRDMLVELNQRDPRAIAAAMRVNTEYAAVKKPRGRGAGFIIEKGE